MAKLKRMTPYEHLTYLNKRTRHFRIRAAKYAMLAEGREAALKLNLKNLFLAHRQDGLTIDESHAYAYQQSIVKVLQEKVRRCKLQAKICTARADAYEKQWSVERDNYKGEYSTELKEVLDE